MKKILLVTSCIALALSICACDDTTKTKVKTETKETTSSTTPIGQKIVEQAVNAYNNTSNDKLSSVNVKDIIDKYEKSGDEISVEKFGDPDRYNNIEKNPIVTMEMEDGGKVVMELYPQIAPNSVENFISLINNKFYDGLIFHRVMPSFMAQGGDPKGDGTGGPDYSIVGEFSENGYSKNTISHDVGVLSMARATDPDSAGSQFFIVTDEQSKLSLDGLYAAFGKVIEGMDEVYKIVNSKVNYSSDDFYEAYYAMMAGETLTDKQSEAIFAYQEGTLDRPINPPVIKSITVETFGVEYGEPHKNK